MEGRLPAHKGTTIVTLCQYRNGERQWIAVTTLGRMDEALNEELSGATSSHTELRLGESKLKLNGTSMVICECILSD